MPNVYVVNDSGHDFSAAEPYGDLIALSEGELDKYNVTGMKRIFDKKLQSSSPSDWLLHTGPGIMSAIACSIFAAMHGRLNLLIWRAEANGTDRYVSRKVVFKKGGSQ